MKEIEKIEPQCADCNFNIGTCLPGKCEILCGNPKSPMYDGPIINDKCPEYSSKYPML